MAVATIQIDLPGYTGLNLVMDLYPRGIDIASVSALVLTEATNRKGTYIGTTTAGLEGVYYAIAREGSTVRGSGHIRMTDTAIVHIVEELLTPEDIWLNPERTLTMTAAEIEAVLTGDNLVIHRGDTTEISLTGLGNISDRTGSKLYFTVKDNLADTDDESVIQISELDGLLILNGEDQLDSTLGSLTVTNETLGNVTITLKESLTKELQASTTKKYHWDIQVMKPDDIVRTLTQGILVVNYDVTQASE